MKINTNSNTYIITYSVVMVVVVAVLLSLAAMGLKDRQQTNMLGEKQSQIVKALGVDPATTKYDEVVTKAVIVDASGEVVSEDVNEVFEALNDLKGSFEQGRYPLFMATSGIVVPLYGAGLWGPIWGYIALESDMNTIKGIVLDHQGETPGLGAEITTPKHQALYVGETVYEGDQIVGITLKKGGAEKDNKTDHMVDAITGGTKTSDGVSEMISNSLNYYKPFFDAARARFATPTAEEVEFHKLND